MEPLTDVRAISDIGYGFMASKALFAALNLDLFSHLSGRAQTLEGLAQLTGTAPHRLQKLLTACVSLGLVVKDGARYANAPASETYLVRGAPAYFGDYFRYQIGRQVYPAFERLDAALQGENPVNFYDEVSRDPVEAEHFSRAQHAGSLGPAHLLARRVDLGGRQRLLDVAGGSGAYAITLCRRYPQLMATILDFPNVIEVAKRYVAEAGLASRVGFIGGNALEVDWPADQHVVLMSYLLNAVAQPHLAVCRRGASASPSFGRMQA